MACRHLSRGSQFLLLSHPFKISPALKSAYLQHRRSYAVHRDTPSSLLSQQLDRVSRNEGGGNAGNFDSVGPFPLGVQSLNSSSSREKVKPWNELTPGGKVLRSTARATNFTVILIGAGLSTVLVYALATELFAKNSPTVLYGDACDRIIASSAVTAHLPAPLSFHTTPPSPLPPRHRNRHPQSHLAVDSKGVEHLLLHFWITSSHATNVHKPSQTWSEWLTDDWDLVWNAERLSDGVTYVKEKSAEAWESTKHALAFISGMPVSSTPSSNSKHGTLAANTVPVPQHGSEASPDASSKWGFLGLFKNLKIGGREAIQGNGAASQLGDIWESGEVHVDFVKDENGIFQYRYLLVDIPTSRVRRPIRIIVERGNGFTEQDGVFLWQ